MIIKDAAVVNRLVTYYEQSEMKRTGKKQWLDAGFYAGFDKWLKTEHNCVWTGGLEFTDEKDYIWFLLSWA